MSRKIKVAEKKDTVMRSEILQVADIVARDKGIDREDILEAMEHAILKTTQLKYGAEKNLSARIDRVSGDILVARNLIVVHEVTHPDTEISLDSARKIDENAVLGTIISEELPSIDFGRIAARSARQIIVQKVRTAERNRQFEDFSNIVGHIVTGVVKRVDFSETILDVAKTEGLLKKVETIPNENFKVGERIKVLLVSINKESAGPMLYLSRTNNEFMKRLFEQEVPEVYDNVIKIVAIARDPGSKAKIAVTASDPNVDPVGACVGVKGSRVQSISDELKGEKIDIILWSDNPAVFIVNALSPAEVIRIVIDEENRTVEAIVPDDQLSSAIGRRGQNVRLASKLTGYNITVVTDEVDSKKRAAEHAKILAHFVDNLDVDDMVAHLLITEGYSSIDELAESSIDELSAIDGFNEDLAREIQERSALAILKKKRELDEVCEQKGVAKDLRDYSVIGTELLEVLVNAGIRSLNDLGDLSTDELLEIVGDMLTHEEAEALIMDIRKDWF